MIGAMIERLLPDCMLSTNSHGAMKMGVGALHKAHYPLVPTQPGLTCRASRVMNCCWRRCRLAVSLPVAPEKGGNQKERGGCVDLPTRGRKPGLGAGDEGRERKKNKLKLNKKDPK